LTALQLNASPGLLRNTGLATNVALTTNLTNYNSLALISPYLATLASANLSSLTANTVANLKTISANSCPALADNVPLGYPLTVGLSMFTGLIASTAYADMGSGDLTKFVQALNQAQSYADQASIFINTAVNSQTYLADTFTSMNSMITGGITDVNLATQPFGTDLANLGQLIDLANLGDFGSPLGLIRQIYGVTGSIPSVSVQFASVGIPVQVILNLTDPTISVVDSIQRLMYTAMINITGNDLKQILSVMKVTTEGITSMADLLNPVKLFPNSYQSLTVPTKHGLRAIYINTVQQRVNDGRVPLTSPGAIQPDRTVVATDSVNQNLLTELPEYVMSSLS
jgi:hypothetical protein